MHRCLLVFLLGCASLPESPKDLFDGFSLVGSGRGRVVGSRKGSFAFESFFDQEDLIIVVSVPFHGDEIIRITPTEIVLSENFLDKQY